MTEFRIGDFEASDWAREFDRVTRRKYIDGVIEESERASRIPLQWPCAVPFAELDRPDELVEDRKYIDELRWPG